MKKTKFILGLICLALIIAFFVINKLHNETTQNELDIFSINVNKGEKIEIAPENKSVQILYKKIEKDFISKVYDEFETYENNNFYIDELVTYNDLSDESKLYYAYQQLEDIERKWFNNCDELSGYYLNEKSISQICKSNPLIIKKDYSSEEWFFNNVTKEKLEEAYQNLYGIDKQLPKKDFAMSYIGRCIYSSEKDDYLCYKVTGSNTSLNETKTKIIKVIKYHDYIEIYDKYIWIENKYQGTQYKQDYYKSHLKKEIIVSKTTPTSTIDEKIIDSGALYKHIFKKDSKNNYYWYSSERIE